MLMSPAKVRLRFTYSLRLFFFLQTVEATVKTATAPQGMTTGTTKVTGAAEIEIAATDMLAGEATTDVIAIDTVEAVVTLMTIPGVLPIMRMTAVVITVVPAKTNLVAEGASLETITVHLAEEVNVGVEDEKEAEAVEEEEADIKMVV